MEEKIIYKRKVLFCCGDAYGLLYGAPEATLGAFSIAAPTVWNALPDNVVNAASLTIFKKHLKTHLFDCC